MSIKAWIGTVFLSWPCSTSSDFYQTCFTFTWMRYIYPGTNLRKTFVFLDDNNIRRIFCSSNFCYRAAEIFDDLPPIWSADDEEVLQNRCCDQFSFLVWICSSCVKVSRAEQTMAIQYLSFVRRFRWIKCVGSLLRILAASFVYEYRCNILFVHSRSHNYL